MKNLFLNLDALDYKPSLFFKEKDRVSSYPGAILTVICSIAITVLGVYFLKFCTDRIKYDLNSSDIYVGNNNFTFNDFNYAFSLRNGYDEEFKDFERIFSIKWYQETYLRLVEQRTGRYEFSTIKDLRKCNAAEVDSTNSSDPNLSKNKGYYCMPEKLIYNFYRYGVLGDQIGLIFDKCQNSTNEDGSLKEPICYPEEIINAKIKEREMFLFVRLLNREIDHQGMTKETIFKPFTETLIFKFSLDIYLRYLLYLEPIEYNLDQGYIFEDISTFNSYRYHDYDMQVDVVNHDPLAGETKFGMMNILLGDEQRIYKRDYVKLQSVAANLGGIIKFFFFGCQILLYFYSKNLFFIEYGKEILNTKNSYLSLNDIIKNFKPVGEVISNNNINNNKILNTSNNIINNKRDNLIKDNLVKDNYQNNSKSNIINYERVKVNEKLPYNNYVESNFPKEHSLINYSVLHSRKVILERSNLLFYDKKPKFDLQREFKAEKDKNNNNSILTDFLNKIGYENKEFKIMKKRLIETISIERIINSIIELIHFRNYMEVENQLCYFGNGIEL